MLSFLTQNLALATYVLLGFTFLAIAWLHWDARAAKEQSSLRIKSYGFSLLSLGFICQVFSQISSVLQLIGFVLVFVGIILVGLGLKKDRILPSGINDLIHEDKEVKKHKLKIVVPYWILFIPLLAFAASAANAYVAWRLYGAGKIREYKFLFLGFTALSVSLLAKGLSILAYSDIIVLQNVFGSLGLFWIMEHLALVAALAYFVLWFWNFIRFRVGPELFISFSSVAVVLSTLIAVVFAMLLFYSAERDVLSQLKKDVQVLDLAVSNLEDNALTAANLLARTGDVAGSLRSNNYQALYDAGLAYAEITPGIDYIIFTDASAQILVHTGNLSQIGQSMTYDDLVLYAITEGESRVSPVVEPGVLGDIISIKAVHPVVDKEQEVIGVVQTSVVIDDAFADRVKAQTGLEVSIYSKDRRIASTVLPTNALSRRENTLDANDIVVDSVINNGEVFAGAVTIINEPYHGAYAPLTNTNDEVIGMLFVGKPQSVLLNAVSNTLMTTFFISILASLLALYPAYVLARRIERNRLT